MDSDDETILTETKKVAPTTFSFAPCGLLLRMVGGDLASTEETKTLQEAIAAVHAECEIGAEPSVAEFNERLKALPDSPAMKMLTIKNAGLMTHSTTKPPTNETDLARYNILRDWVAANKEYEGKKLNKIRNGANAERTISRLLDEYDEAHLKKIITEPVVATDAHKELLTQLADSYPIKTYRDLVFVNAIRKMDTMEALYAIKVEKGL